MGVISSGRCEKIDLETWSNIGLEKKRARMPYKQPLSLRHTFRFRRNFSEIDSFTSSWSRNSPKLRNQSTRSIMFLSRSRTETGRNKGR